MSKAAAYTVIRSFMGKDIPNNAGCSARSRSSLRKEP